MGSKESDLFVGEEYSKPVPSVSRSRRASLLTRLILASSLLVAACSASKPADSSPTTFTASECGGNFWAGPQSIIESGTHPLISSIGFCFDENQQTIRMMLCFTQTPGEFRVTSRQMNERPNSKPGYLFNRPYKSPQSGCETYAPVIDVEEGEADKINIGERDTSFLWGLFNPPNRSYSGIAFQTTRRGNGLEVEFLGPETLDPETVVPRGPNEPPQYFQR